VLERFDLVAALFAAHARTVAVPLGAVVDPKESASNALIVVLKLLLWPEHKVADTDDRARTRSACSSRRKAVWSCDASPRRMPAFSGRQIGHRASVAAASDGSSAGAATAQGAARPTAYPRSGVPLGPSEHGSGTAAEASAETFSKR
jgi:hypothetical protein